MNDNAPLSPETPDKPTWLQLLEAESWQAELIISGAAIFGTLQLPALLNSLVDYAIFHVPEPLSMLTYFLFFYCYIGATVLIMSFVLHFGLRALWIGMVGLSSVFPHGVNPESKRVNARTMEQIRARFGDLRGFNQRLDDVCSVIFAQAFYIVMIFVSIALLLFVFYLIGLLVYSYYPAFSLRYLLAIPFTLAVIPGLLIGISNLKPFRNSAFNERWQFSLSQLYGRIFYTIFYQPVTYISYTIMTNLKSKQVASLFGANFILAIIFTVPIFLDSNATFFIDRRYLRIDERADRLYSGNYANRMADDELYIRPFLPSDVVTDSTHLSFFIPLMRRERDLIMRACDEYTAAAESTGRTARDARRTFNLDCLRRGYRFLVNDTELSDYSFKQFTYDHRNEEGIQVYLDYPPLRVGENWLTIEHTKLETDDEPKIDRIPFYFYPG